MKNKYLYYSLVILLLIFTLGPILYAVILLFTKESQMFSNNLSILPSEFTLDNIKILFTDNRNSDLIYKAFKNSVVTAGITVLISLVSAVLTAYSLSLLNFKYKKLVKTLLLATMVLPVLSTIIPLYKIYSDLALLDNIFSLSIVYVSSFLPTLTWLAINYFEKIPKEIISAAKIDGLSQFKVLYKIILPLARPLILSLGLISFLMSWGQYQVPLILASSINTKPLSIVVGEFMQKDMIAYGVTIASGLFAVVLPVIIAVFLRKHLLYSILEG